MSYFFYIVTLVSVYLCVALSMNILFGFCGLLSLAPAAYFGIGCYTYAILMVGYSVDSGVALLLAVLIGVATSPLLAAMASKFRDDFFVFASIAVSFFISGILYNWSRLGEPIGSIENMTNGPAGIASIPPLKLLSFTLESPAALCCWSVGVALACAVAHRRVAVSRWGMALRAMRDDEISLQSAGYDTRRLKWQATAISCAMLSAGGAVYASCVRFIDPTIAGVDHSILMISVVIIGGLGSSMGPVLGAFFIVLLPEVLRLTPIPVEVLGPVRALIYGLVLVLVIHIRPQGLAGKVKLRG